MTPEFRLGEVRALGGNRLVGVAMKYASIAPALGERFAPGAFGELPETMPLNMQHDPDLKAGVAELRDTPAALHVKADVLPGVYSLVKNGALNGFSVEFFPVKKRRVDNVRVVEAAELVGLAVVDRGAYPRSTVEARARIDDAQTDRSRFLMVLA